jgi:hypothetical protein
VKEEGAATDMGLFHIVDGIPIGECAEMCTNSGKCFSFYHVSDQCGLSSQKEPEALEKKYWRRNPIFCSKLVTCDGESKPACEGKAADCEWKASACAEKTPEEEQAFKLIKDKVKSLNSTIDAAALIKQAATFYEKAKEGLGTSAGKVLQFFTDPENDLSTFVNNALKVIDDPDKVLAEFKKFDYLNPNDALVTLLKNEEKSVPKKIIFGAFCVHGILFFGDIILTFAPIPNFLRSIVGWFFGSSSIFFMFTNGVAAWAAYTSTSREKTQKYYYVAGIYGIVQAADIITYFLGFGPLKIIYKFLSYGFKVVYLADAIIVTFIPLYFVYAAKPENFEAVAGEGWSWLSKQSDHIFE